jgi:hypothetical protein
MAEGAKAVLGTEKLDALANLRYFNGEVLACDLAWITVTPPNPITSVELGSGRPVPRHPARPLGRCRAATRSRRRELGGVLIELRRGADPAYEIMLAILLAEL